MSGSSSAPVQLADRVHLIGIGGAGMSGIARILLARGIEVSGSDAKQSRAVLALQALGARIGVGHDPDHLPAAPATVVVSSAIRPANPELDAHVRTLAQAYKERPVTLIRVIYALRDTKIQTFADAFKLRR